MKWQRPSGTFLELADTPENEALHLSLGWKPVKGSKKTTLYKRLEGEIVEGDEDPFEEVIIESEKFIESTVESAIKDGWFKTEEAAAHAPPDKAKVDPDKIDPPKGKPGPKPKPKPAEAAK